MTISLWETEQQTGDICCHSLSEGTEEYDEEYNPQHVDTRKEGAHVDEHTHTDQEIRNEDGVSDKLDTVHQGRHMGNVTVQDQSREESAEDALDADE